MPKENPANVWWISPRQSTARDLVRWCTKAIGHIDGIMGYVAELQIERKDKP